MKEAEIDETQTEKTSETMSCPKIGNQSEQSQKSVFSFFLWASFL